MNCMRSLKAKEGRRHRKLGGDVRPWLELQGQATTCTDALKTSTIQNLAQKRWEASLRRTQRQWPAKPPLLQRATAIRLLEHSAHKGVQGALGVLQGQPVCSNINGLH